MRTIPKVRVATPLREEGRSGIALEFEPVATTNPRHGRLIIRAHDWDSGRARIGHIDIPPHLYGAAIGRMTRAFRVADDVRSLTSRVQAVVAVGLHPQLSITKHGDQSFLELGNQGRIMLNVGAGTIRRRVPELFRRA